MRKCLLDDELGAGRLPAQTIGRMFGEARDAACGGQP